MNTDDRQQHIDTLVGAYWPGGPMTHGLTEARRVAAAIFDSTDPAVHDVLAAALIAHSDRGRVLAALADAGWLDEEAKRERRGEGACGKYVGEGWQESCYCVRPTQHRGTCECEHTLATEWEPTP